MVTVAMHLENYLCERGLWQDEASRVLIDLRETLTGVTGLDWDRTADQYHGLAMAALEVAALDLAIRQLERDSPSHFALSILRHEQAQGPLK